MFIYTFLLFLRIDKIENNLRYIEPQNGKKFKRLSSKKVVSYGKKNCTGDQQNLFRVRVRVRHVDYGVAGNAASRQVGGLAGSLQ